MNNQHIPFTPRPKMCSCDIDQILDHMVQLIDQLDTERGDIRAAEARRDLLSRQLALVGDVQQLGPAMQSHPLSTVSQRYAHLKRTRAEQQRCQQLLTDQLWTYKNVLHGYAAHLQSTAAVGGDQWLAQRRQALADATAASAGAGYDEFMCLRDLFGSSGQQMLYATCERLRGDLDDAYRQLNAVGQHCVELIEQYDSVAALHHSAHSVLNGGHRLQRFADWCGRLLEQPTVGECRDIGAHFRRQFGESVDAAAAVTASQAPVYQLACQLQACWQEDVAHVHHLSDRLQTLLEEDQAADAADRPFAALEQLVVAGGGCVADAALHHLAASNRNLLLAERQAERSGQSLVDMSAVTGVWFVEEMAVLTAVAGRMAELLQRPDEPSDAAAVRCVHAVEAVYAALRQLQEQLCGSLLDDMIDGIFGENPFVLDVIGGASQLQLGVRPLRQLMEEAQAHLEAQVAGTASAYYDGAEVAELRARLLAFGEQMEAKRESDVGAALFVRWSALFDVLELRLEEMCSAAGEVATVPDEWQRVDQVNEATDLAVSS